MSDLHFGDAEEKLVHAATQAVREIGPDALVITGDVTQKGKRAEFAAAQAFLERFDAPRLLAAGNHDTPYAQLLTRGLAPFSRFERRMSAKVDELLALDAAWVRAINTSKGVQARLDWSLGSVSKSTAQSASTDLAAAPDHACRVIACHHPLITPTAAPFRARTRGGSNAAEHFALSGVDLILSGHLHTAFAEPLPYGDRRTYAVGAATAFSSRTRGEPAGFNLIEIAPSTVSVVPYVWSEGGFKPGDAQPLHRRD